MATSARQFQPQITRTGGVPTKFRFAVQCSGCSKTDTFAADHSMSDDVVKGQFNKMGWLLGRSRAYDLCPACLRATPPTPQTNSTRGAGDIGRTPVPASRPDRMAAP